VAPGPVALLLAPEVVAVPVVPVALVPEVEPGDVPALLLLDAVSDPAPGVLEGDVVVDEDDDTGGGGAGVTTVVDDDEDGGVVDVVAGGDSWRCWHAPSASRTLAATAVRIGRFMVAPCWRWWCGRDDA
jgi:hypothetical protein